MEIIIEVLARHGKVRERLRCNGPLVTIGRSYQNDVIIADPYVSPRHLQLEFDEESRHWRVLDVSSHNGVFLVGVGRLQQPHPLHSGEEFEVGETRIRILQPDHEIAETRNLPSGRLLADYFASPVSAIGLMMVTLGLYAFAQYLGQGTETKLQELLLQALMFLSMPFLWACVWGLIGRISVHDARFSYHLSMGTLLVLSGFILAIVTDFLTFGLNGANAIRWLDDIAEGVLLCGFLLAGLMMATGMTRKGRWILANSLAWSVVGLAILFKVVNSDPYDVQGHQNFNLKPPFAQMQHSVSLDVFMQDAGATFARLDKFED